MYLSISLLALDVCEYIGLLISLVFSSLLLKLTRIDMCELRQIKANPSKLRTHNRENENSLKML